MALIDFQTALGRLVRAPNGNDPLRGLKLDRGELLYIQALTESAGFRFSVGIQRSWCLGRAEKSAHLTLSILPGDERRRLLDEWINSGAGTQSFYATEADSFFDFIIGHLSNPSHELTVCQLERATLRASNGTSNFAAPDPLRLNDPNCPLRHGSYAGLVRFYAEPHRLLDSLQKHEPLPPLSSEVMTMLFGPGLEQLCRPASMAEVNLWDRLDTTVAVRALLSEGYQRETVEILLNIGAIEYAD
jgi:hypothetical protein